MNVQIWPNSTRDDRLGSTHLSCVLATRRQLLRPIHRPRSDPQDVDFRRNRDYRGRSEDHYQRGSHIHRSLIVFCNFGVDRPIRVFDVLSKLFRFSEASATEQSSNCI